MDKKPNSAARPIKKTAIYVDVEDDLTSIIGKVKDSSGEVIALVPPRRVGVLQSVVNLKLLRKEADSAKKSLILITADKSLGVLATSAKIPVAKNLTAEAKLLDVPEEDDEEEIITGLDQTIGELSDKAKSAGEDKNASAAVMAISDDDKINDTVDADIDSDGKKKKTAGRSKGKSKIPDFKKFRKWIIIGAAVLLGLVGLLVWAFLFSTATITISANTSNEKIDQPVSLTTDGQTKADENRLRMVAVDPVKKTNEIEFTATGSKEIGEKAKGNVVIHNEDMMSSFTLAAGSTVASGNMSYTLNDTVVVPGVTGSLSNPVYGTVTVGVTAANLGADFNLASGKTLLISGYGAGIYAVTASSGIGGGSKETVNVVQQSDIDAITDKIKNDTGSDSARSELQARFPADIMPIQDSFSTEFSNVTSTPAVGEQATKATAKIEVTYLMYGVAKSDISGVLMHVATNKLKDKNNEMVFDNGFSAVQLLSYNKENSTLRLAATAKIGPKIDEDQLRQDAAGKKANEISSNIKKVNGVDKVEVDIPFWLGGIMPDASRITIVKSGL